MEELINDTVSSTDFNINFSGGMCFLKVGDKYLGSFDLSSLDITQDDDLIELSETGPQEANIEISVDNDQVIMYYWRDEDRDDDADITEYGHEYQSDDPDIVSTFQYMCRAIIGSSPGPKGPL